MDAGNYMCLITTTSIEASQRRGFFEVNCVPGTTNHKENRQTTNVLNNFPIAAIKYEN